METFFAIVKFLANCSHWIKFQNLRQVIPLHVAINLISHNTFASHASNQLLKNFNE